MLKAESARLREKQIFEEWPVGKSVAAMIVPTIISQIIIVLHNIADTWFVGLANNPDSFAAISLCLPVYSFLSGFSNLFGVGAAGVVARALGKKHIFEAKKAFSLAVYGSLIISIIYSLVMLLFGKPILYLIGADSATVGYSLSYTFFIIVLGGVPAILAMTFCHLIRAVGNSKQASFGMILGAILNIFLDAFFMFLVFSEGKEVEAVAVATALSNLVSFIYFLVVIFKNKDNGIFSFAADFRKIKENLLCMGEILRGGIPSFCMITLAMISNCVLNSMMSALGSEAVAGIGIVRKIDQLAHAVNQGTTQGMLPLAAYCYTSKKYDRMWSVVKWSTAVTMFVSILSFALSELIPTQLVSLFIQDPLTVSYGSEFLRIICIAVPIYSFIFIIISLFQAVGRSVTPFLLSILHKGTLDILLMFIIRSNSDLKNILWATPVSEVVALVTTIILLISFVVKLKNK
ncbi:MAG: hypothetical protein IJP09_01460 [Clostridia bacterium]|nr:hypothetical protein [Clostridia bacterium]